MEQFKIRKDGFKEIRKTLLVKGIPVMLIAVFGAVAMSYFNSNNHEQGINVLPFMVPFVLILVGFALNKAIKKQREILKAMYLLLMIIVSSGKPITPQR